MLSKTVLFVSIGIAVGILAGIFIGLASYPVATEEKAQASMPSMMDNQSMESMGSMSGNQSMMPSMNMTGLMGNMSQQPFNSDAPITIPLIDGYYNGSKVFFIHTEVSDEKMAQMMTRMVNFQTLHVPELVNMSSEANASKVYVFTNGVPGSGPYGGGPFMFQIDVFDSVPGQQGYSTLHVPYLVTWNEGAMPRVLISEEEILQAERNGELTVNKTGNVVNAPIIAWKENGQNRTATSIDTPYTSMREFSSNVTFVNTDNYVAKLMLTPKSEGDGATPSVGVEGQEEFDGSANAVAAARSFLLAKLPELGIHIANELDLHTDMVVAETESEYHVEFSVRDSQGRSHEGHVEVANGEVVLAIIDGKAIHSSY